MESGECRGEFHSAQRVVSFCFCEREDKFGFYTKSLLSKTKIKDCIHRVVRKLETATRVSRILSVQIMFFFIVSCLDFEEKVSTDYKGLWCVFIKCVAILMLICLPLQPSCRGHIHVGALSSLITTRDAASVIVLVVSVCMSDDNFQKSGRRKFVFAHAP